MRLAPDKTARLVGSVEAQRTENTQRVLLILLGDRDRESLPLWSREPQNTELSLLSAKNPPLTSPPNNALESGAHSPSSLDANKSNSVPCEYSE